jgi:hypothetical protein
MNRLIKIFSTLALLTLAQVGIACDAPAIITVPDGATATQEELVATQKAVKEFIAAMDTYLVCIVEEEKLALQAMDNLEPEVEQRREELMTGKYNAGVDAEKLVEAQWNAAVQAYKARSN